MQPLNPHAGPPSSTPAKARSGRASPREIIDLIASRPPLKIAGIALTGLLLAAPSAAQRRAQLDFEADELRGALERPEGVVVLSEPGALTPAEAAAVEALRGRLEAAPGDPALKDQLARALRARVEEAHIRALECLDREGGDPARCAVEEAEAARVKGPALAEALRLERALLREAPTYVGIDDVIFRLASHAHTRGELEAARALYQRLIKGYPKSKAAPHAHLALAELLFEARRFEEALALYRAFALKHRHHDAAPYARYKQGWCHYNLNQNREALAAFIEVTRAERGALRRSAQRDAVRAYVHIHDAPPRAALTRFEELWGGEALGLARRLAEAYASAGMHAKSIEVYRALLAHPLPEAERAACRLGLLEGLRGAGDLDGFIAEARKLAAPLSREILDEIKGLAIELHKQAKHTRADVDARRADALYTLSIELLGAEAGEFSYFHAELLYELERWADAARAYERSLRLAPRGRYASEALEGALHALKKLLPQPPQALRAQLEAERRAARAPGGALPTPRPFSPLQARFLEACELSIKNSPKSPSRVYILYESAMMHYQHHSFEPAIDKLRLISERHTEHELAQHSAQILLDIYRIKRDFESLKAQIERYLELYKSSKDSNFYKGLLILNQHLSAPSEGLAQPPETKKQQRSP